MADTIRLYHYTKADYLGQILSSGLMRLSTITDANDPFEGAICHTRETDNIGGVLGKWCKKDSWDSDMRDSPFLFVSLSAKMSSPSMWGYYADSHKGVCLVFDIPVFFGGNESDKRMFVEKWDRAIFPLEYSDKKPSILDISIGDDRYKYQRIIRDAGIRKGKDWEHENEVRIQVANDLYTPDKHRDVVWQDGWPYYSGLLGYLKGIILGVRCKKRVSWVECQLNALHYTDVNVVRAYESPVDYKVMLRPEDGQIFKDEDEKVDYIRRSFENHVNSQDYDRLWFMKPRFAPVRKGGG